MQRRILFSLFLYCSFCSYGQNLQRFSSIGLSVEAQNFSFLDKHASPLLYKTGIAPVIGCSYQHQGRSSFFSVGVAASIGKAEPSRFGSRYYASAPGDADADSFNLSSLFVSARLSILYLRKLVTAGSGKCTVWLGGQLQESAEYADAVADYPWLLNDISISPAIKTQYQLNRKNFLEFSFRVSALSLLSREIYALFPKSSSQNNVESFFRQGTILCSVNQFQRVQLHAGYHLAVSKRMLLEGSYGLQWLHYSEPKPVSALDIRYGLTLQYLLTH